MTRVENPFLARVEQRDLSPIMQLPFQFARADMLDPISLLVSRHHPHAAASTLFTRYITSCPSEAPRGTPSHPGNVLLGLRESKSEPEVLP